VCHTYIESYGSIQQVICTYRTVERRRGMSYGGEIAEAWHMRKEKARHDSHAVYSGSEVSEAGYTGRQAGGMAPCSSIAVMREIQSHHTDMPQR